MMNASIFCVAVFLLLGAAVCFFLRLDYVLLDCINAWPIIVFTKQLKDNTRKIMEIFEATGQKDGRVVGHTLYRFHVEDTIRDGRGNVTKVIGHHARVGCISPELYFRLRDNGVSEQEVKRLFPDGVWEESV